MRRLIVLALFLALALPAAAQAPTASFEKLTVAATSVPISAATLAPTGKPERVLCVLTLETGQVRYRVDGTDPDASTGHVMDIGGTLTVSSKYNLTRFRAIRTGSTSGVLSISCW